MLQAPIPDILMLLAVAVAIVTAFRFLRLTMLEAEIQRMMNAMRAQEAHAPLTSLP